MKAKIDNFDRKCMFYHVLADHGYGESAYTWRWMAKDRAEFEEIVRELREKLGDECVKVWTAEYSDRTDYFVGAFGPRGGQLTGMRIYREAKI